MSTPHRIASFQVERRLGSGGMAEVFLARKDGAEGTSKLLVIKRILPDYGTSRRFRSMFIEEAQLATRLNHPNIVQVYEFFDAGDEGHVLAMEYVDGPDLGALMRAAKNQGSTLGPYLAAWICAEAAKGLHYAHEKRDEEGRALEIVHRDVSPQNVLLSQDGVVKITDFGIASARFVDEDDGVIKGKYGYMSPEQARGERVDRRSDLYSLGVILWECLTGRALHGGLSGEALLDLVRSGIVEPPTMVAPGVPLELEAVVMRLLAAVPEDRYATGREVAAAIGRALLEKQQLVDATLLEQRIATLLPAHDWLSDDGETAPEAQTQAAAPLARGASTAGPPSAQPSSNLGRYRSREVDGGRSSRGRAAREVRHVVLMSLRLHVGRGSKPAPGESSALPAAELRAMDNLRKMLGEMAYKHALRWQWHDDTHADAIAGLSHKHSRAPMEAALLAEETHEAIAGYADELSRGIQASIGMVRGIASGTRNAQGQLVRYVVQEPAPRLAAVLGDATPAGCTLMAGALHRLVRREFAWGDVVEVPLDSSEAPKTMKAHRLLRSLSREELREQLAQGADIVGRDTERADLASALHQASKDGGQLVMRAVVGELGIGKSALLQSFLAELPDTVQVVRAECTPMSLDVPFGAAAELVREILDLSGEEPFEVIAERIAGVGGGAAAGDASHPVVARLAELASLERLSKRREDDGHDTRRLLANGLQRLFAALALRAPTVLVLESFQWADRQSLDLFGDAIVPGDPLPLLVVMLTRPDERMTSLLEGKVRVELMPLTAEEQVRLVEHRLGVQHGVREVCADLLPRAAGNPFFLLELVEALLERGHLEIRSSTSGGRLQRVEGNGEAYVLPQTLEQLLANRLQELPADERAIVDRLAVAGGPMSNEALRSLTRQPDLAVLERLCRRGLCERRGHAYDFRHPLMRDVVYAALDSTSRRRLHAELGEALSTTPLARGAQAAIVARHFLRADLPRRAAPYYVDAAETTRADNHVPLAAKYFERALACLGKPRNTSPADVELRLRALDGVEALYRITGKRSARLRTIRELSALAKRVGSPRTASVALLRAARFDLDEGRLLRGIPKARMAAQLAEAGGLALVAIEAESLLSELLRESGQVHDALSACDRAWAACDPRATTGVTARTRAEVLTTRGVLLRRLGRVREAVDAYADAIAFAKRAGAKRLEARTKNALAYAMFVQGRYEDAIALATESIGLDLSSGGRFQVAKTLTNIGHAYARLGQKERADAYLGRARDAHERYGDLDGYADTLVVCAEVAIEYNLLSQADAWLAEAERLNAESNNAYDAVHTQLGRALWLRRQRQPRQAAELALAARRAAEEQALVSYHFTALAIEAAARVDLGEMHSGTLLATTALGALETLQGCEYGLEVRVSCADTLKRASSPQAPTMYQRAVDHAMATLATVRDPRLARSFAARPYVAQMLITTPVPQLDTPRGR